MTHDIWVKYGLWTQCQRSLCWTSVGGLKNHSYQPNFHSQKKLHWRHGVASSVQRKHPINDTDQDNHPCCLLQMLLSVLFGHKTGRNCCPLEEVLEVFTASPENPHMYHNTSLHIFHSIHNTILFWRLFPLHISRKLSHVPPHSTQYILLHPQHHTLLKTLPSPPYLQKTLTCPTSHHSIYSTPSTIPYSSEESSFSSHPHISPQILPCSLPLPQCSTITIHAIIRTWHYGSQGLVIIL